MKTKCTKCFFLVSNCLKNLRRHRKRYFLYTVILLSVFTVFFSALTIHSAAGAVLETHLEIYAPGGVWLPVEELDLTGAVYSREQVKTAETLASLALRTIWVTGPSALLLVHYTIRFLRHVRLTEYAVICSVGVGTGTVLVSAAAEMFIFLTGVYITGIFTGFGCTHLLTVTETIPDWLSLSFAGGSLPGWQVYGTGLGMIVILLLFHMLALFRTFQKTTPNRLLSIHT